MALSDKIRIPVLGAHLVFMRYSPLPRAGRFDPNDASAWRYAPLQQDGLWWEIDLSSLGLPDGSYEYDFQIERPGMGNIHIPDPYTEELTRLGGYRSVFHFQGGHRIRLPFSWDDELPGGARLPNNNEIVIYELPMRWVDAANDAYDRQVSLGTFDKALFEHLRRFQDLGVNTIELLPIQDSPDTLNWGYGTRFFFAPDLDMGDAFDLKLFIRECHRRSIRVILDVVMNHSRACPLEALAFDMFYLRSGEEEPDPSGEARNSWGGQLFRYRDPRHGAYHARLFHFAMAEFWIKEYHVDGFRIDEFKGINHWDFIRDFRRYSWNVQRAQFPGRPFIVIAEDSWRRAEITHGDDTGKVVDSMWDFDFRDEVRRLALNRVYTVFGQPSRSDRVRALVRGDRVWNEGGRKWRDHGFGDMSQRVMYNTSHDVENHHEQRLFPFFIHELSYTWPDWSHQNPQRNLDPTTLERASDGVQKAFELVFATFALMLTSAGIPMFLAGEEFGDLHDTDHANWRMKMSDPVDWARADRPGHRELRRRIRELVHLRVRHPSLQRNEVQLFGFHPDFDANDGKRVFAYCRTDGRPLGSGGQVVVVANCGPDDFAEYRIEWHWGGMSVAESGGVGQTAPTVSGSTATMALRPYQVRVFSAG